MVLAPVPYYLEFLCQFMLHTLRLPPQSPGGRLFPVVLAPVPFYPEFLCRFLLHTLRLPPQSPGGRLFGCLSQHAFLHTHTLLLTAHLHIVVSILAHSHIHLPHIHRLLPNIVTVIFILANRWPLLARSAAMYSSWTSSSKGVRRCGRQKVLYVLGLGL